MTGCLHIVQNQGVVVADIEGGSLPVCALVGVDDRTVLDGDSDILFILVDLENRIGSVGGRSDPASDSS